MLSPRVQYADRLSWANSQLTVTLLDRFELISPKNPEHATKTSVVIRATDTFEHDEAKRNVVFKLMRNKSQFDREINVREVLEDKYVVDVLHTSTDEHFKKLWKDSITWNLPKYTKYKYGLVMPAAQRNLMVVLMQERVDIEEARGLAVQIALCLRHMHEALMIHSDLKVAAFTFSLTPHLYSHFACKLNISPLLASAFECGAYVGR